jgi:dihydroneopterin aldolase
MSDTIRIFLHDCRIDLRVGIYSSEMQRHQPVTVNVELEAALPHRFGDNAECKMDRVIDYEAIYTFVRNDLTNRPHIYLLETVADHVIDFCFQDARVRRACVRLEKTAIFEGAAGAGVEMTRTRPVDKP